MKNNIHPKYNNKAKVTCACGNEFEVGSTMDEIKTELCSLCHPFFTGEQKLVDTARRVEKFQSRMERSQKLGNNKKDKSAKRKEIKAKKATAKK